MDPNTLVNFGIIASYILIGLALVAILLANIINIVNLIINGEFSKLIKSAVGLAVFGLVFLIGWGVAGAEVTEKFAMFNVTATSSKLIGGTLITTYVMLGLVTVGVIFSLLARLFR